MDLGRPKYPNFVTLQGRIVSFDNSPGFISVNSEMMASAGFFYVGSSDQTRCFFCGGGLRNWEYDDNPWVEHARWFPKCHFLLQNKGAKFIEYVHQPLMNVQYNLANTILNCQDKAPDTGKVQPNCQHLLETVAARAVVEMGYTIEQILQAMDILKADGKSEINMTSADIMSVLLDNNFNDDTAHIKCSNVLEPRKEPATAMNGSHLEALRKENQRLKLRLICRICHRRRVSVVLQPCSHAVCCNECSFCTRKCPFCRAYIDGSVDLNIEF